MRMIAVCLVVLAGLLAPRGAIAQDAETLADIRQQLTVLYVEIRSLKRELSTTGAPAGLATSGTTLARVNAIEAELARLTGHTERIEQHLQRVVEDGTNRIGDLEFRLVELEGGDVSALGETTTLGGESAVPSLSDGSMMTDGATTGGTGAVAETGTELAVGEGSDFKRAKATLDAGDARSAADQFAAFIASYPGSPLEAEAHLRRGEALDQMGQVTPAARAFLDSYSRYPESTVADEALFHLGKSLGKLDKVTEACVTLGEVNARYPESDMVGLAESEMRSLGCN